MNGEGRLLGKFSFGEILAQRQIEIFQHRLGTESWIKIKREAAAPSQ